LTKSRFKIGLQCPTKLFYTKKEQLYPNQTLSDSFLAALAEGGFQVGEYAKCLHRGCIDVTTLDYDKAVYETDELLRNQNVTISEAAFRYDNLFVRVDIIVKNGNEIQLKEVKAKSFSLNNEDSFFNQDGTISSDWQEYLYDIVFQFYVVSNAYPQFKISSFLTLSNKDATCPTDGLNQKFRITRDSTNRKGIRVSSNLNDEDLKHPLVIDVPVDEVINQIFQNWGTNEPKPRSFIEEIEYLSNLYKNDQKAVPVLGSWCKKCEFKCSDEDESKGKKSGFKECWNQILNWSEKDFQEASVLDLWASRRKDQYIEEGIFKLKELDIEDVEPKPDKKPGLSSSQRQWLQVEKTKNQDNSVFVDKDGLRSEFSKWTYPLHIIDFETATVPIGFVKGQAPYSTIVFQFSHHTIDKDWNVKHAGEFLAVEPGRFPNFDFVRELKRQLEKDNGTIFMYSAHENSCLNAVYRQLKISQEPDKDDLCDFIQSITYSSSSSADKWIGPRKMVDQLELVKRYYFDPWCNGSNSIKKILPSVLRNSDFLKKRYSLPIYGSSDGIPSFNFANWTWLEIIGGEVSDPYKTLPKLFIDANKHDLDLLTDDDELNNGGAALTAYARMQFSEMSDYERKELKTALLKYCETDTMACVMLLEAWRDWIK